MIFFLIIVREQLIIREKTKVVSLSWASERLAISLGLFLEVRPGSSLYTLIRTFQWDWKVASDTHTV